MRLAAATLPPTRMLFGLGLSAGAFVSGVVAAGVCGAAVSFCTYWGGSTVAVDGKSVEEPGAADGESETQASLRFFSSSQKTTLTVVSTRKGSPFTSVGR